MSSPLFGPTQTAELLKPFKNSALPGERSCSGTNFALEIRSAISLVVNGQYENLAAHLLAQRAYRSLAGFVEHIASPFMEAVGEAWASDEIAVYQEHLCTDIVSRVLLRELAQRQPRAGGKRILFAAPEGELHGLGSLMARCVLADHGANCIGLGMPMPSEEIVRAAIAWKAEIVALSFSFSYSESRVLQLLECLHDLLPSHMALWAGGAGVRFIQEPLSARTKIFTELKTPVQALHHGRDWVDYLAFS